MPVYGDYLQPRDRVSQQNARAHWFAVLEVMKAQAVDNATSLRSALKARSEALASQSSRRQQVASSQWVSAAAMDSPLFASPRLPGGQSAPLGPSSTKPVSSLTGHMPTPPQPGTPPSLPTAFQVGAAAREGAYLRRRGGGSSSASASAHPSTDPAASARAGYGGAAPSFPQDRYSAQRIAAQRQAKARLSDAQAVESTIVELGEMMGRMAGLVAGQEETLDSIADDVGAAQSTVEAAQAELYKYYSMVSEDRGLIVKSLGVVAAIIVLFMVFKT